MTHEDTPRSPSPPDQGQTPAHAPCERFREQIERLLFEQPLAASAVTPTDPRSIAEIDGELGHHLGECSACSDLLALHAELIAWEDSQPTPSEHEEARLRRRVLAEIERERGRPGLSSPRAQRLAVAAGVVLALGAAFAAGRLTDRRSTPLRPAPGVLPATASPSSTGTVAARADLAASLLDPIAASLRNPEPTDPVDRGPYSFENVQLHDLGGDRVRLSFDYSIHLDVERDRRDPLVTEILVHAILDGGSLGTQLKAIDAADQPELSPRLRAALIRTMLEDESVPARQAALARLLPDASLPDVEGALLQVLEHEESVHMRLLAIDALAAGGVTAGRLEEALEAGPAEPGQALRLRVGDLRQRM